jgi:hypothetical protein
MSTRSAGAGTLARSGHACGLTLARGVQASTTKLIGTARQTLTMTSFGPVVVLVAALVLPGCGNESPAPPPQTAPSPIPQTTVTAAPIIESLSPSSVSAGVADVTITVKGSNFADPRTSMMASGVTWSVGLYDTYLDTTFVSSTELTAVIPAALVARTGTAKVTVQDWRGADDMPSYTSNAITFTVN